MVDPEGYPEQTCMLAITHSRRKRERGVYCGEHADTMVDLEVSPAQRCILQKFPGC